MSKPSDACQAGFKGGANESLYEDAFAWIMGREWKRSHGNAADIAAWDKAFQEAFSLLNTGKNVPSGFGTSVESMMTVDMQNFMSALQSAMFSSPAMYPGWSDQSCTMDWSTLGGFFGAMAALSPADFQTAMINGAQNGWKYTPLAAAVNDPAYSCDPPIDCANKMNWKPWAIGGAVVVGLGIGGYLLFGRKNHATRPELVAST